MVRRSHDEGAGWAGNDTRLDLWHGTSGQYAGLDRFGRIADMKFTDYSGSPVDFDRRDYTYDRSGNPTSIENTVYQSRSQVFGYDNLNRLTSQDEGILVSGSIALSDLTREYHMDLLGNLATNIGFRQNSTSSTFTHAVNATNEITTITRGNPAGRARVVYDDFAGPDFSEIWTVNENYWSISGGKAQVDSMGSPVPAYRVQMEGPAIVDDGTLEAKIELPSGGATAGIIFSKNGSNFYSVEITDGTTDNINVLYATGGGAGQTKASASATIHTEVEYTLRLRRNQRHVEFDVSTNGVIVGSGAYDSPSDFGDGTFGLAAYAVNLKFDDFTFTRLDQVNPAVPHWSATAKTSRPSNNLLVESAEWGGEAVLEWAGDDAYIAQAVIDLNSGDWADLRFRYADPDNYYAARIGADTGGGSGPVDLIKKVRGKESTVDSATYSTASTVTVKVQVTASDEVEIWVDGTSKIEDANGLDIPAGGVALAGEQALFDDVKVGYDNTADDDIDDGSDDLVIDENFSGTTMTPTHDNNGNLTHDGTYKYTYDHQNRLVKATRADTDVVIQTAGFDGLGRRIKKVVTNSGDLDGTTVYHHNGNQIIETRDGSNNVMMQVYHGTQYIDEIVGMRVEHGRVYVHQDANWNVTGLTDLTGRLLERNYYSPYGEPEITVETHFFDYDDDGDVDDVDIAAGTSTGVCWGSYSGDCKRLDADGDRHIDAADYAALAAFADGLSSDGEIQRVPAATQSRLGNSFAHQGLVFDTEIGSYQNRARQYAPPATRFMQRDPLAQLNGAGRGYQDGVNLYHYVRSNPLAQKDPSGTTSCGKIVCHCDDGDESVRVHGDSWLVVPIWAECITYPLDIFCRAPCGEDTEYYSHECCHLCHARSCLLKYIWHAIDDICYNPDEQVDWHWE